VFTLSGRMEAGEWALGCNRTFIYGLRGRGLTDTTFKFVGIG
jgi:hypothetical protein